MRQSKWVTGRWIGAAVTLTMITVFGGLAPAYATSADAAAPSAVTHSTSHSTSHSAPTRPNDILACTDTLESNDYEVTPLRLLACGWAVVDPNITRGVLLCVNVLVFTGVDGATAGVACGNAPSISRSRAATSVHPASFNAPPGGRILSARVLRPASAAQACSVNFEGAIGYQKCGDHELYAIVDSGSGPGILQAFVVGTNGALWTAWGTTTGSLIHGWESMGGNLSDLACTWNDASDNIVVQGIGPQGTTSWCRYRTHATASWGGWFECNNWAPSTVSYDC